MIMSILEERIQSAAAQAAAGQKNWTRKHIPIKIDGKVYWVTTEVPPDIQNIIGVLPKEPEAPAKRPHQIKTRLSDAELESFEILLCASGLSQAEFIRGMVLHGSIEITQTSLVDANALEQLTELSSTMGKIAGMIRQTIIVNKQFATITPEVKADLEHHLRTLRRTQTRVQQLAEDLHGHLQA